MNSQEGTVYVNSNSHPDSSRAKDMIIVFSIGQMSFLTLNFTTWS